MLQIDTFPVDDMALVAVPGTRTVAVVDAVTRTVLEGWRDGQDEAAIVDTLSRTGGIDRVSATQQARALRHIWAALARSGARPVHAPSPPPDDMRPPALDGWCRVGPQPVRLRIRPPRLAALVAGITAGCRMAGGLDGEDRTSPVLDVWRVAGHYLLFQDGRHLLTTDSLMVARSETLRRLVLAAHPGRAWLAVLHAAAVAGPAGAALLCGTSGAGKSTLTALLLTAGLDLVTDDYAPLEMGSNLLWPVPYGLSVKEGSWPLVQPHFPHLPAAPIVRTRGRRQRYLQPPRFATAPQPVRCLIFPCYHQGAAVELAALRSGEALTLCAQSGGWYESSRERLAEFVQWLERMPAYVLSYGDGAAAAGIVRRLLAA